MFTKRFTLYLLLLGLFFISLAWPHSLIARSGDGKCETADECQEDINKAQAMLDKLAKDKNTLSNQIQILDSQITLTTLRITQTQKSIANLEVEIGKLSDKIGELDQYLNHLSALFLNQIQESYKLTKRLPDFALFTQTNFTNLYSQFKYLKTIQKLNQDSLVNMETARTNFDLQKQEKTQKQDELDGLKKSLTTQSANLNKQKSAKNTLLAVTKNDEKKYQELLRDALSQLSQLKNFSQSGGSSCLSSIPDGGEGGWFMSQRDPRWCKQYIGLSKDTIGEVGCFISSLTMIWKKYGYDMTPSVYGANPSYFLGSTAWMTNPNAPPGYTYKQVSYSQNTLDNELKAGRPVIAQISMKSIAGMHFIVIKSGSDGRYKINDPWFGADLDFSSHYSTSAIMSLRLITK